jgi:hypothetical protein
MVCAWKVSDLAVSEIRVIVGNARRSTSGAGCVEGVTSTRTAFRLLIAEAVSRHLDAVRVSLRDEQ